MGRQKHKTPLLLVGKLYDQMAQAIKHGEEETHRDIILFTGKIFNSMIEEVRMYEKQAKRKFRIALLVDQSEALHKDTRAVLDKVDLQITCDARSMIDIQKNLRPYLDELVAITCRGEDKIHLFRTIIPHVPYLLTPDTETLNWATDKHLMRRRFFYHNDSITPAYTVVSDASGRAIRKIQKKVGYPCIVKPTGMAASRLVSIAYHQEELEKTLKRVIKKMKGVYTQSSYQAKPTVLIEQYMEGSMYSVDGYVGNHGELFFCPMVHIKTGKSIGFDDFFGYLQMTPTLLKEDSVHGAQAVAKEGVHALGLKNTSFHAELLRTEDGWKLIEIAARVGGFRHMLYAHSYDINHTMNDIRIRMGEVPDIPSKTKGYTAAMKFFAKKEGELVRITGIKKSEQLASCKKLYVNKKPGDVCTFAKHGGSSVFNIILFNKDRSKLLADIRRLEQMIDIQTS